ncbi:hypothetical protein TVAG_103090 [Trichomonas vaginalis G3]|uniref:Uncharacterized protein n=1 Tax=Trichomonas vaginalis (strain ATCC PRA-98 / G3) TaxID=412133 RepID=A2EKM0_TRIV3|nr:armadillo (ARM) repeat-containing protein family [Trichomonas vaginalis G3]EAY06759.1 hypothetical protein TVAG_103090 [Trichomonas vaginalis G3]KAI5485890.1 armadillo (ARM) repeat-containing protein family [Trichomonas vaginalis G3]|eukprot:XP_001318982.1 hypothetical protein [Trichomonas vaginalis G3]
MFYKDFPSDQLEANEENAVHKELEEENTSPMTISEDLTIQVMTAIENLEDFLPILREAYPLVFPILNVPIIHEFGAYLRQRGPNCFEILKYIIESNDTNRSMMLSVGIIDEEITGDLPDSFELIYNLLSINGSEMHKNHFINANGIFHIGRLAMNPETQMQAVLLFGLLYGDIFIDYSFDYYDFSRFCITAEKHEEVNPQNPDNPTEVVTVLSNDNDQINDWHFNMVDIMKLLLESPNRDVFICTVNGINTIFKYSPRAITTLGFHFFVFTGAADLDAELCTYCYEALANAFRMDLCQCIPPDQYNGFRNKISEIINSPDSVEKIATSCIHICNAIIDSADVYHMESILDVFAGTEIIQGLKNRVIDGRFKDIVPATLCLCKLVEKSYKFQDLLKLRELEIIDVFCTALDGIGGFESRDAAEILRALIKLLQEQIDRDRNNFSQEEITELIDLDPTIQEILGSQNEILKNQATRLSQIFETLFVNE